MFVRDEQNNGNERKKLDVVECQICFGFLG